MTPPRGSIARRWHLAVALLAILLIAGPERLRAQGRPQFVWDRYDVEITLQADGSFGVAETQTLNVLGSLPNGRAFRTIPLDRVGSIRDISVAEADRAYTEGSGRPFTYRASEEDGNARIDWQFPPMNGGSRTFIVRYRVTEAIRVYEAGDQLYWTAVWDDRPAPVRASRVTLRFPSDVSAEQVKLAWYSGREEGEGRLADPRTAVFEATDIPSDYPFEVRAQFPHGLVAATPPSWQADADLGDWFQTAARPVLNFLLLLGTLAIAVLGTTILGGLWYTRGRDPEIGALPKTLSEPPGSLPPGVVGTLVDERADVQDVVATLVDLANRGVIRITEEQDPELVGSSRDYRLELLKPKMSGLRSYEKTVLKSLFHEGEREVQLSDLKDRFAASIPRFQDQLHAEVERAGLFHHDPEKARRRYRSIGNRLLWFGLIGGFLALFFLTAFVELAFLPFLALAILGGVMRWLARAMPQKTRAGALEAARWQGFGRFLREGHGAESPEQASAHGERWLPYAIALGVDQTWVRNLASVGSPPPRWYGTTGYGGPLGGPNVVVMPSPWGGWGGGYGGSGGQRGGQGGPSGVAPPPSAPAAWGQSGDGGLQGWSDGLADLLNRTSDVLSKGGGSGWSGGGFGGGGGGFGGGGGGGSSGGGSGGFS